MKIKDFFEKGEINKSDIIFLSTSIWDFSLYKAWSNIFSDFISNIQKIKELLKQFVTECSADEAVLLEKNTLIKLCSYNNKEMKDSERFEKMTTVIKKFKLSCRYVSKTLKKIVIKTINNIIYIDEFDNCSYIIVAFSNKNATLEQIGRAHV